MSADTVIEIRGLSKRYKHAVALDGLSLTVPRGSVYAFLGRNGAGKTTTLKILLGLTRATGGEARVLGLPCDNERASLEIRRRAASVNEKKTLYTCMTVEHIIRFTRPFFPAWNRDLESRYLKAFEIPLQQKVGALSKGTLSRLNLLLAMCRGAELLLLDEPTEGLDPAATEVVLQELMSLAAGAGATIFFSSHQLHEVEQIADRVCLIHAGRALLEESLDDIKLRYRRVSMVFEDAPPVEAFAPFGPLQKDGRTASVVTNGRAAHVVELARSLGAASIDVQPVTLKELFLESTRSHHAAA
ncbi:MAG: ABC transporter ATP-binding protein [Bryobacteraceae bacterium]|nr:ABC transporter ATP-binding protein [Bryobacteraceae bacterium]